jgi:hypothetical protein
MNNTQIRLIFPKGGGGSWLSNLIWHLENSDWTSIRPAINYDGVPQGPIIREHYNPNEYENIPTVLFSTKRFFNVHLNEVKKILHPIHTVNNLSDGARINFSAEKMQPWLSDNDFKNFYCTNIDLEYEWIFSAEPKFIKRLYEILEQYNISYIKNDKYIRSSLANYRSTCELPTKHLGNTNSFEWLAFCLAMARAKNIPIEPFDLNDTIDNIKPKFYHLQLDALEFVKPYTFTWKQ